MAKQKLTPERIADLQRTRDHMARVSAATTEILTLFTEATDMPPLALPQELNGWTQLRYEVGRLVKAIDAQLATVDGQ